MTAPRRRILVVEDGRVQALRVQRLLEGGGYDVAVAHDGSTASNGCGRRAPT